MDPDKTEALQQGSTPSLDPTAAADDSANLFEVQLVMWTNAVKSCSIQRLPLADKVFCRCDIAHSPFCSLLLLSSHCSAC